MVTRGCGERVESGLYCCVPDSPFGQPIQNFLIDPVTRWIGPNPLRSPMFISDKEGVRHICIGIGKEYYPHVPDFVEEASRYGVSKRIPVTFDPSRLSKGRSRLLLMHPNAIPLFEYELSVHICPKRKAHLSDCVGDLWSLSALKSVKNKHEVTEENARTATIQTPSVTYTVDLPVKAGKPHYLPGIVLMLSTFFFQYVHPRGFCPPDMRKKFEEADCVLEVVPE